MARAVSSVVIAATILMAFLWSSHTITEASEKRLFSDIESLPHNRVGLVLGTASRFKNGDPNPFFTNRIQAAAELFHAGKVDYLLLSGDYSTNEYNEPQEMKDALIRSGIGEEWMVLDYAGRRTLDSVIRAKEVFGLDSFTVISQRFHNERAVFTAVEKGMDVVGYNADAVSSVRVAMRDWLSRVMAVLDVKVLNSQPGFLWDPVVVDVISRSVITSPMPAITDRSMNLTQMPLRKRKDLTHLSKLI